MISKTDIIKSFLKQNYQQLKNKCILNKELFEDDKFPALRSSIFKLRCDFISKDDIKSINWKRPNEFLVKPKQESLIDICQGKLGNWYYL
jgi:hypothetical protein